MLRNFVNIFSIIDFNTKIDFDILVKKRMQILEHRGYDVSGINWDLYTKILKAKFEKIKIDSILNSNSIK